jgi:heat shock protein HslJ
MKRSLPVLLAALLLAACTAASPSGSSGPSPATGLDGRTFLSTGVTVAGADRPLVEGTLIRISFQDGNIGANGGCNTFGGTYLVSGGRLFISGGGMTEMACDEDRMAQDEWLFAFLGSTPEIALDGDTLVLTSGDTVITLLDREVADPDLPLVGITWSVQSIIDGGAVSSVPDDVLATLTFFADGTVQIATGCNSGGGKFEATADTLRFRDLVTTEMACGGAAGQMETAVLRVLTAEVVGYRIEASSLELMAGQFGLGLQGARDI